MKKKIFSIFFALFAICSANADLTVIFDLTGNSWGSLTGGVSIVGTTGNNGSADWSTKKALTYISGNCYSYTITGSTSSIQFNFYVGTTYKAQMPYTNPAGLSSMSEIRYSYGGGTGTTWTQCTTCCQVSSDPYVTLTVPTSAYVGQGITLSAEAKNFTDAIISLYVKLPDNANYETTAITSPYTPTTTGSYTFKAIAVESSDANISAFVEKTIVVSDVSAGAITIKWKKGDDMTWSQMGIYEWSQGGGQLCGTWPGTQVSADGNGWYSYTFSENPENIIFNNYIKTTALGGLQVNGPVSPKANVCLQLHNYYYCLADCSTGTANCDELGGSFDVKWINDNTWSDMSVYAWYNNGDGTVQPFGSYPGKIITANENGIYSQTFVKFASMNMIFISPIDGAQTINIENVFDNTCYRITTETQTLNQQAFNVVQAEDCTAFGQNTGVKDIQKNSLTIYPSPAYDKLKITNDGLKTNDNLQISDITGKIIYNSLFIIDSLVDIRYLQPGIYFVKIGDLTGKFIKK